MSDIIMRGKYDAKVVTDFGFVPKRDDLISRAAALDAISTEGGCGMCASRVLDIPAVDAVPVVHARWVERMYKTGDITTISYFCSKCDGEHYFGRANYCPNCGAKMDGERKEDA